MYFKIIKDLQFVFTDIIKIRFQLKCLLFHDLLPFPTALLRPGMSKLPALFALRLPRRRSAARPQK